MANRPGHRRFGHVRQLPSGRYQASYLGPDGRRRTAPETFDRKKDADLYLAHVESLMTRGEWTDPARARSGSATTPSDGSPSEPVCARERLSCTAGFSANTSGRSSAWSRSTSLSTPMIRNWRAELLAAGVSETMAAKSYHWVRLSGSDYAAAGMTPSA